MTLHLRILGFAKHAQTSSCSSRSYFHVSCNGFREQTRSVVAHCEREGDLLYSTLVYAIGLPFLRLHVLLYT